MLRSREDSEGIEGVGEDVVVLLVVSGLVLHELLGAHPTGEGWLDLQVFRSQKEAKLVFGMVVIPGVFGDDDHHRTIVVVTMPQGFLAFLQLVEVVFVPVPLNHVKTVQVEASCEEFKDVRFLRLEIPAGEEAQERHRQILAIALLEVIHAVQSGSTAALDL